MPNVGRVAKIGVRAVNVITRDGKKHLIPNELLHDAAGRELELYASPEVRVRMRVPVGYDCDLPARAAADDRNGEDQSAHPERARTRSVDHRVLGERAVEHEPRYWISDPEAGRGNIEGEVFLGIWDRFREARIRIPIRGPMYGWSGAPDESRRPRGKR